MWIVSNLANHRIGVRQLFDPPFELLPVRLRLHLHTLRPHLDPLSFDEDILHGAPWNHHQFGPGPIRLLRNFTDWTRPDPHLNFVGLVADLGRVLKHQRVPHEVVHEERCLAYARAQPVPSAPHLLIKDIGTRRPHHYKVLDIGIVEASVQHTYRHRYDRKALTLEAPDGPLGIIHVRMNLLGVPPLVFGVLLIEKSTYLGRVPFGYGKHYCFSGVVATAAFLNILELLAHQKVPVFHGHDSLQVFGLVIFTLPLNAFERHSCPR